MMESKSSMSHFVSQNQIIKLFDFFKSDFKPLDSRSFHSCHFANVIFDFFAVFFAFSVSSVFRSFRKEKPLPLLPPVTAMSNAPQVLLQHAWTDAHMGLSERASAALKRTISKVRRC